MPVPGVSRRKMLGSGGSVLAGSALLGEIVSAQAGEASSNEAVVRRFFKSWEKKDWAPFDAILADDFTFTSPNGDDHIGKAAFKRRCWDSQIDFIQAFDIELLMAQGDDVLLKYLCHTKNGKSFRNMEYHWLRNGRIEAIECYFGGKSTFPSAVSALPG